MYTDSLINYETVKYFNGEQHELNRWRETFLESQKAYLRLDRMLQFSHPRSLSFL